MRGVLILGAIVLFLLCLLTLPGTFRILYEKEAQLWLQVLFVRVRLYPKKEQPVDPSDYTLRKLNKKRKKLRKKSLKKAAKYRKKHRTQGRPEGETKQKTQDAASVIHLLSELALPLFQKFSGYLRVRIRRLSIVVSTPDAAVTAMAYGAGAAAMSAFLALVDENTVFKIKAGDRIFIRPDFTSGETTAEADIRLILRVWQLLVLLLKFGFLYIKYSNKTTDTEVQKNVGKQTERHHQNIA